MLAVALPGDRVGHERPPGRKALFRVRRIGHSVLVWLGGIAERHDKLSIWTATDFALLVIPYYEVAPRPPPLDLFEPVLPSHFRR